MRKHTKCFLSAVLSAALCLTYIPAQTVKADIIIDHDSSGIDKGYTFEIANNDKDSQPEFKIMPNGNYSCSWDNDEGFTASRALKFASPAWYTMLGDISFKYWKRIDIEDYKDKDKAYVRFGIRLHNSRGDVFDILEIDHSPDGKSSLNTADYSKIGTLPSKEIFNDYSIMGPTNGESHDIEYTFYVRENEDKKSNTFIMRRNEPMSVNNDIENDIRITISDKLKTLASEGYYIGEITDIGLFLESAYTKGEATIYTTDISIENMPKTAPDEYEDADAPLIVKDYDYGVRTGYYYGINSRFPDDQMEVISPSLFKAQWDSRDNKYNNDPYFERGKQYESGQSYKAISGSSIDYTMNFDAEGSFAVSTSAKMSPIELTKYYSTTELYIVDACSENWHPSEWAKQIDVLSAEGEEYDVYDDSMNMVGTGKAHLTKRYFFISKNAEENGKKGTVTAKHELAPYMKYVYDIGEPLGNPDVLTAQINGYVSKGTAELVKNEIVLPDFIADDREFEKEKKKIDIDEFDSDINVNGLIYGRNGHNMSMKGYAGDEISCEWEKFSPSDLSPKAEEYPRNFYIGLKDILIDPGKFGVRYNESLMINYDISIDDITALNDSPYWAVGGSVTCYNADVLLSKKEVDDYFGCDIFIADKWDGELTVRKNGYLEPQEAGVIESNGVKYDVIIALPEVKKNNSVYVLLKRQKQTEPISGTYSRYSGSIDAADITRKLNGLGIDTYDIANAFCSLEVYGNEGEAVVNSADVKIVKKGKSVYTTSDIDDLTAFILGKEVTIKEGKDYDINGDGLWDTFDLCMMKKQVYNNDPKNYIEPDIMNNEQWGFGMTYNVIKDGVKLYLGPDKSYEAVASLPEGTEIKEQGYQLNDNTWFFTEYDGQYGWISVYDYVQPSFSGMAFGKPVIYLYPEEETDVHVELELTTSELYSTYPKYNNGWDVIAYPDGSLLNKADGTHHKYLFWESVNAHTRFDLSKGFCVAGSDTESFLKEKLTYMGLTEEEMNEFIVYWMPRMEHNAYNLITFQGDLYSDSAKLDISPSPDSLLRLFMAYVPLEKAVDIEPQQLDTFERKGFTVVEWGGTEIK